jgi:hypothetical protein
MWQSSGRGEEDKVAATDESGRIAGSSSFFEHSQAEAYILTLFCSERARQEISAIPAIYNRMRDKTVEV